MDPITSNVPDVVKRALAAQNIDPLLCNLMLPTETYGQVLGMFDKITFETIRVNLDPAAKEVYEPDGPGKGKALSKVPLQRIGIALGIVWDPATTGTQEDTATKSRAKATGAIRKPNGEYVILSEEKTIDVEALAERDRMNIEDKAEKGNPDEIDQWKKTDKGKSYPIFKPWKDEAQKKAWIERAVRKAIIQHRLSKNEKANTGAKERVIRALIAMKSTYTDEELEKPFVYPCVSVDSAKMLANPDVRAMATERLAPSIRTIFGPGPREVTDVSPPKQIPRTVDVETQEVIESASAEEGQVPMFPEVEPEKPAEPELSPEDKLKKILAGYKEKITGASRGAQSGKTVHELIDAIVADPKATAEAISSFIDRCEHYLQSMKGGAT
jgi:hypothetical protein